VPAESSSSRSSSVLDDEELRLPRAPGVIRQFWGRHPLLTDILIAALCLLLSMGIPVSSVSSGPEQLAVPVVLIVLVLAASVLTVFRRRLPIIVLAASIAVDVTVVLETGAAGSVLFMVALYTLAVYRSSKAAWIGYAVGVLIVTGVALVLFATGAVALQDVINSFLSQSIPGLIAVLIGINVGNRRRYLEAIIDRSRQLLVERDQQAQLAAAAERERIAREMHDIVSHSLTVVVALSEGAIATDDPERAREASAAAAKTARGALTEMRSMLGVLRNPDESGPLEPPSRPASGCRSPCAVSRPTTRLCASRSDASCKRASPTPSGTRRWPRPSTCASTTTQTRSSSRSSTTVHQRRSPRAGSDCAGSPNAQPFSVASWCRLRPEQGDGCCALSFRHLRRATPTTPLHHLQKGAHDRPDPSAAGG